MGERTKASMAVRLKISLTNELVAFFTLVSEAVLVGSPEASGVGFFPAVEDRLAGMFGALRVPVAQTTREFTERLG